MQCPSFVPSSACAVINCQFLIISIHEFGPEAAGSGFSLPLWVSDPWIVLPSVQFWSVPCLDLYVALPSQDIFWHRKKVIISDVFIFSAVRIPLYIFIYTYPTEIIKRRVVMLSTGVSCNVYMLESSHWLWYAYLLNSYNTWDMFLLIFHVKKLKFNKVKFFFPGYPARIH